MTGKSGSAAVRAVESVAGAGYSSIGPAVTALAVIALVAALYLARAFFVPLLIGTLASYTLHPLVDWLAACRAAPERHWCWRRWSRPSSGSARR